MRLCITHHRFDRDHVVGIGGCGFHAQYQPKQILSVVLFDILDSADRLLSNLLPRKQRSGLQHAVRMLRNVEGIAIVRLNESDVMRHRLVRKIILAYDDLDKQAAAQKEERRRRDEEGR